MPSTPELAQLASALAQEARVTLNGELLLARSSVLVERYGLLGVLERFLLPAVFPLP